MTLAFRLIFGLEKSPIGVLARAIEYNIFNIGGTS